MSVTIKQFGGHTGSYAGDCAVVEINDERGNHIVIIDTGDSVIWNGGASLAKYVRSLTAFKNATVTLVTTHFHRDHFNTSVVAGFKSGEISSHYYPAQAAKSSGFSPLSTIGKWTSLGKGATKLDLGAASLTFYVPPPSIKLDDQNDQSMAVRVDCEHFSYLSFGDMTKDAYLRVAEHLGGHLPKATVTKYPHHGNHPNNYIAYYDRSLFGTAVLISGNSNCYVGKTIASLLEHDVGAVYCLAGTDETKKAFMDCWKTTGKPVYLSDGALVKQGGVSVMNYGATYFESVEQSMGRRSKFIDSWEKVEEKWTEDKMEME